MTGKDDEPVLQPGKACCIKVHGVSPTLLVRCPARPFSPTPPPVAWPLCEGERMLIDPDSDLQGAPADGGLVMAWLGC